MFRATVSPIFRSTFTVYTAFWNNVPTVLSAADRSAECYILLDSYDSFGPSRTAV